MPGPPGDQRGFAGGGWCCHLAAEVSAGWVGEGWGAGSRPGPSPVAGQLATGPHPCLQEPESLSLRVLGCCRGWGPARSPAVRGRRGVLGVPACQPSASLSTTLSVGVLAFALSSPSTESTSWGLSAVLCSVRSSLRRCQATVKRSSALGLRAPGAAGAAAWSCSVGRRGQGHFG